MSTVALTRLIEAPADEVWRIFVDLPARPQWLCTVREVEMLTTGGFSTGTRWREHRIMPDGSTAIAEFEVEEAIPMCRLTLSRPVSVLITAPPTPSPGCAASAAARPHRRDRAPAGDANRQDRPTVGAVARWVRRSCDGDRFAPRSG